MIHKNYEKEIVLASLDQALTWLAAAAQHGSEQLRARKVNQNC